MNFTYNIQKNDFLTDEAEEKGEIDFHSAIDVFQNFLFETQLEIAAQTESASYYPTITFKSDSANQLSIKADSLRGFDMNYDNGSKMAEWFLSNDMNQNIEGLTVEYFIELFFKEKIENQLNLQPKNINSEITDQSPDNIISYTFSPSLINLIDFLLGVGGGLFATWLAAETLTKDINPTIWIVQVLLFILWFPRIFFGITYFLHDRRVKVTIDSETNVINYEKDGDQVTFNRNDIKECFILRPPNWGSTIWYSYIHIVLKDDKQVVITNFISKPEKIAEILKLHCKCINSSFPFLPY